MKRIEIGETRRELDEAEVKRLLGVDEVFHLAEARVRTDHGAPKLELIFRFTISVSKVSLALIEEQRTGREVEEAGRL